MTYESLTTIIWLVKHIAYLAWIVLFVIICRQISKRNLMGLKISSLYLINSVAFIIAWGLILKLALIVRAPIGTTMEESIKMLRNLADNSFLSFILYSIIITCMLAILNLLYMKYFSIANAIKHTLTLSIVNLIILSVASYISTESYYLGLLHEIYSYFINE